MCIFTRVSYFKRVDHKYFNLISFPLQPKLNPHVKHLFQAEDGLSTDLFPVKISNIQELILFALTHESMPNWCHISHVGKIQKVVIVLVSGVGAEEYVENQECFSQCNTQFEQVRESLMVRDEGITMTDERMSNF